MDMDAHSTYTKDRKQAWYTVLRSVNGRFRSGVYTHANICMYKRYSYTHMDTASHQTEELSCIAGQGRLQWRDWERKAVPWCRLIHQVVSLPALESGRAENQVRGYLQWRPPAWEIQKASIDRASEGSSKWDISHLSSRSAQVKQEALVFSLAFVAMCWSWDLVLLSAPPWLSFLLHKLWQLFPVHTAIANQVGSHTWKLMVTVYRCLIKDNKGNECLSWKPFPTCATQTETFQAICMLTSPGKGSDAEKWTPLWN